MTEKRHPTPAVSVIDLERKVSDLQEYVAGTIRRGESARTKTLEDRVANLEAAILSLDEQLKDVQSTFFKVSGKRAQHLPIVEVE
jgi:hypothetical protein